MELPEPFHLRPIRKWRAYMKAHKESAFVLDMRAWLRNRRKRTRSGLSEMRSALVSGGFDIESDSWDHAFRNTIAREAEQ